MINMTNGHKNIHEKYLKDEIMNELIEMFMGKL
jgi:hypothetical protein